MILENSGATAYPPGFQPLQLRDVEIDIGFDGEASLLHHHFTATTLTCNASSEHPAFESPYVAARMSDGNLVILFVKTAARPVERVALVIDTQHQAALAACHYVTAGRLPRPALTIVRGAVGSSFSLVNLTTFPLHQPPATKLVLTAVDGADGKTQGDERNAAARHEPVFNRLGHLTNWRSRASATGATTNSPATGRLLSLGEKAAAVLPWSTRTEGGTLVFNRAHGTFWGHRECGPSTAARQLSVTYGLITQWNS